MQSASIAAQPARRHYRHELRTLTYITLDQANGGIVRNLNHEGVAVQAVAALRQDQRVRLRFELRSPRVRVEAYGQVTWASPSGQCEIRFLDLPDHTAHQIKEWMFANLLDAAGAEANRSQSIFADSINSIADKEIGRKEMRQTSGRLTHISRRRNVLTTATSPRSAIRLKPVFTDNEIPRHMPDLGVTDSASELDQQNWLSRPISGRTLAWLVDSLVVTAALLLFALIFLSIAHELPRWPLTLAAAATITFLIVATYRMMFAIFGGQSAGTRLAQASSIEENKEGREAKDRFR